MLNVRTDLKQLEQKQKLQKIAIVVCNSAAIVIPNSLSLFASFIGRPCTSQRIQHVQLRKIADTELWKIRISK